MLLEVIETGGRERWRGVKGLENGWKWEGVVGYDREDASVWVELSASSNTHFCFENRWCNGWGEDGREGVIGGEEAKVDRRGRI